MEQEHSDVENLIQKLSKGIEDDKRYRNDFIDLIKKYYDGILKKDRWISSNRLNPLKRMSVINLTTALNKAGKNIASSYINNTPLNTKEITKILSNKTNLELLLNYCSSSKEPLKMSGYMDKGDEIFSKIKQNDYLNQYQFDTAVGILYGGIGVTFEVASLLDVKGISFVEYSIERKDIFIRTPHVFSLLGKIFNKNVLVVDNVISTGETMSTVMGYVAIGCPKNLLGLAICDTDEMTAFYIDPEKVLSGRKYTLKEDQVFVCKR